MAYLTLQDVTNKILEAKSPLSTNEILWDMITEDEASDEKTIMQEGYDYYRADQAIEEIDFTEYKDRNNQTKKQKNKANNHLTHIFHRQQVIEKVAYLLKKPPTWTHEKEGTAELFTETLGTNFPDLLIDWATGASNKGVEYLYVYLKDDKFNMVALDARECIPIYDTAFQKNLEELIRYYKSKLTKVAQ